MKSKNTKKRQRVKGGLFGFKPKIDFGFKPKIDVDLIIKSFIKAPCDFYNNENKTTIELGRIQYKSQLWTEDELEEFPKYIIGSKRITTDVNDQYDLGRFFNEKTYLINGKIYKYLYERYYSKTKFDVIDGYDKIIKIGKISEKRRIYRSPDGYCIMYEVPETKKEIKLFKTFDVEVGKVNNNTYYFSEFMIDAIENEKRDEFAKLSNEQKKSIQKFSDITKPKENVVNGQSVLDASVSEIQATSEGGKHKNQTRKIKQTYRTRKRNKKY